jgi:hypothetical protein
MRLSHRQDRLTFFSESHDAGKMHDFNAKSVRRFQPSGNLSIKSEAPHILSQPEAPAIREK